MTRRNKKSKKSKKRGVPTADHEDLCGLCAYHYPNKKKCKHVGGRRKKTRRFRKSKSRFQKGGVGYAINSVGARSVSMMNHISGSPIKMEMIHPANL